MNRKTLFLVLLVALGAIINIAIWFSSGKSPGVQWSFALAKQNAQLVQSLGDPVTWKMSDEGGAGCGKGGEVFVCRFHYTIHGPQGAADVFVHWEEQPNMPTRKEVTVRLPQGTEITIYP